MNLSPNGSGTYAQDGYYSPNQQPQMGMGESFNDYSNYSADDQETLETQWRRELTKTEEEVTTLRQVLTVKTQRVNELKKKLGVSVWSEMKTDLKVGFQSLTSSEPVQKTNEKIRQLNDKVKSTSAYQAVATGKEKTSGIFSGAGSKMSEKFSSLRNFTSFKSFEERVGSAVSSVKDRLTASRSEQNFEEALKEELEKREMEARSQEGDPGPQYEVVR